MNRSESKSHNTALKMHTALFRLLEKKEFSEISVTELCAEAEVNRSTFYSHYSNTYELLKESGEAMLLKFFKSYKQSLQDVKAFDATKSVFVSPEYMIPYLEFVKENKQFFKIYMDNLRKFDSDKVYLFLYEEVLLPVYEKNGIFDKTVANYMSKFYLNGITSVALEWIQRDCTDDEYLVCKIITDCIRPYSEFFNKEKPDRD